MVSLWDTIMLACVSYATGVLLLSHVVQQPGQILSLDKVCGAAHPIAHKCTADVGVSRNNMVFRIVVRPDKFCMPAVNES